MTAMDEVCFECTSSVNVNLDVIFRLSLPSEYFAIFVTLKFQQYMGKDMYLTNFFYHVNEVSQSVFYFSSVSFFFSQGTISHVTVISSIRKVWIKYKKVSSEILGTFKKDDKQ